MHPPCQLCGETEHVAVSRADRDGRPLHTVLCTGCGVVTNDPIPSDDELAAFYRTDYRAAYKGSVEPRKRQVWRNFRRMRAYFADHHDVLSERRTCLEIGSGSGEFLFLAKSMGLDCVGIEPNEAYAEYSRTKLGLDVRTQTIETTEFQPGSFDFIRLAQVLEHMRDPVRSLKTLRRWLSDDGIFYVEIPDLEWAAERMVKGRIFHFGHIFNFNHFTLRLAAGLAGFEELPFSRDQLGGTGRGFFRKRDGAFVVPAEARDNASRVKAFLDAHYSRTIPRPAGSSATGRLMSIAATRVSEVVATQRFGTHRQIADHFAQSLS